MRWPNPSRGDVDQIVEWAVRNLSGALLLLVATAVGSAQSVKLPDFQNWDELDVSARISRTADLSWVSQGRFSSAYSNPASYLTGADVKVEVARNFEITPSYYYLAYINTADQRGHFQVPMLSATWRDSWGRWTVADRNRFMGAIRGAGDFWIYLNRPRVDYRIGPSRSGMALFAWDEIFYFSVFHGWTRNRLALGIRRMLNERWAADVYYLRQDDNRIQPRDINGVGVTLEVRIR